ncbi:hypothetical protein [Bifidobacterium simiarum]|nr:hypothetical protein [Bifidobacterium simiarum]
MSTLTMKRRARNIEAAQRRRTSEAIAALSTQLSIGNDLPTGIRRYRSKEEFLASIRAVIDKVDAE